MESQAPQADVIVVGGGLAGLTAACYLARAGVAVTLFERASNLGGRAATVSHDGYCFNRGAHALYTGGAASDTFRELGVSYAYGIPKNVSIFRRGKLHVIPRDPVTLVRTSALTPGEKLELLRFFTAVPRLDPRTFATTTVEEWLTGVTKRPGVRALIAAIARTYAYSAALDIVSADVVISKLQATLKYPIHYIDGGWQTLVDGLRRAAERAGARIVSGNGVASVELQDGRVRGARLRDGRLFPASAVIIATTPRDAAKLLDAERFPALCQIVDGLVPCQVANLDVSLRRLPPSPYYVVQDVERPRFMTVQSVYARVAPRQGAVVSAFKQLDPAHLDDPRDDERDLEDLMDATLPGWRDAAIERIYLPRIDASGSLPTAASGGLAGRPGVRVTGLANLYLAGDWVGSEGFQADASMASAREAARLLLQDGVVGVTNKVAVGTTR